MFFSSIFKKNISKAGNFIKLELAIIYNFFLAFYYDFLKMKSSLFLHLGTK